jgi:putative ABC transport system permease protein
VSLWRQLRRGVLDLWDRAPRDQDTADEVAQYRDALVADGIERGLTPEEARRAAQLALGGETQLRETARSYGWERAVAAFFEDLRFAWRGLRADRAFSVVAICTIAVGIGAATAIVSAVRPVLFDSLPYPDAARVRAIVEHGAVAGRSPGTFGMYHALAERTRTFERMTVFAPWSPALTGDARPERLTGQRVSAEYFRVLGVAPARGRDLRAEDDRPGSAPVVIISDGLWRRRFAADPAIIGRNVRLDDDDVTIVGVMPAGFENVVEPGADAWTTLKYDLSQGRAWGHHLSTLGRLRADVDPATAEAELDQLGAAVIAEQRPSTYGTDVRWSAPSLQDDLTRDVRPALWAVLVAVGVVLLLACVNVTNLLLVRGARRREEFALRAALGASRSRLIRQVLTEALLLTTLGGAIGVAIASASVGALIGATPAGMPRVDAIAVDWTVLLSAMLLTTCTGLVVGLLPALQASGQDRLAIDLGTARITGGRRRLLRSGLVASQVAFALVLLTGSGLLVRSMQRLLAVSPGFDAGGVVTMQLQLSPRRYADEGEVHRFFAEALDAVQQVPGVTHAAFTSQLPLSGDHEAYGVTLESPPEVPPIDHREIFRYAVSPGYLELMRIPVRAGRSLTGADRVDAPWAVVVNESFARRYLGDRDPLGQRLWIGPTDGQAYTVVGVVGDVKQLSLAGEVPDAVYTTTAQWRFAQHGMSLVVRGAGDAAALVPAVREAIWTVDAEQPVVRVATMESMVAGTSAERRFILLLFQVFAVAALVLTMAGIYGMMAGLVAERTRELGLRAAVGATAGQIVGLVLRFGARVTGIGLAVGVAGAVIGTRLMRAMLYGVSHLDVVTYGAVVVVLAVMATIACALPALRAARIDPARALRG